MIERFGVSLAAAAGLASALALAGCNETGGMPGPSAASPIAVSSFNLPPGAACTKEIGAYQTVTKSDLDTGNLEQKVYDQIQHELARAATACSAGKGGEAHSIVATSKSKHGYRA